MLQAVTHKTDIVRELQKELLALQGYKKPVNDQPLRVGIPLIEQAFPQKRFPTGVIHDFKSFSPSNAVATNGFIAGLLGRLSSQKAVCVWVNGNNIFPPALKIFGINPENILFINARKPLEALWTIEEALKCKNLSVVVGELKELNFTESRRLQLAVEKSGVTGLIHRHNPKNTNPVAAVANWEITSLKSELEDLPGPGFPQWSVKLAKVRNGTPGKWQVQWHAGHFELISPTEFTVQEHETRNTG